MIRRTEGGEEPLVLAGVVTLLKGLLNVLLGVLALRDLLEGVVGDGTLKTLELESVTGGHDVVVVDDLDERLDLGALGDTGLSHAAGDGLRVTLNAGNDGVRERVSLGALVGRLDDDNLLACEAATGDDGDTASLEDCDTERQLAVPAMGAFALRAPYDGGGLGDIHFMAAGVSMDERGCEESR